MAIFKTFMSLGEVGVPSDYKHDLCLSRFCIKNNTACLVHPDITDEHFGNTTGRLGAAKRKIASWKRTGNPSNILHAGEVYRVTLYAQRREDISSPEERINFLKSVGSVFPGAQGVCLLFDQKKEMLPKTFKILCMDDPAHLPIQSGNCWMPVLGINQTGPAVFSLGDFHSLRSGNKSLLVSFVPI